MSRGYGVLCPKCDNALELEEAEVHLEGTSLNLPIRVFRCNKCAISYRWKSMHCPLCGAVRVEVTKPMAEPLFRQLGLYCDRCRSFSNGKEELKSVEVEENVISQTN